METPLLIKDYAEKLKTFNNACLYFLSDTDEKNKEKWERRTECAVCFVYNYLSGCEIKLPDFQYRAYLTPSLVELRSLIFEKSEGKTNLMQNASSAIVKGQLLAYLKDESSFDIYNLVTAIIHNLQKEKGVKNELPMWFLTGLPQYLQNLKNGIDSFDLARELKHVPSFPLKDMNIPTARQWAEFGIMGIPPRLNNTPGLTASASLVQFLVEKEGLGLKKVWELIYSRGELKDFYSSLVKLCGKELFVILNNYLYYIDQPPFPKDQNSWTMEMVKEADEQGRAAVEKKEFKVMDLL